MVKVKSAGEPSDPSGWHCRAGFSIQHEVTLEEYFPFPLDGMLHVVQCKVILSFKFGSTHFIPTAV